MGKEDFYIVVIVPIGGVIWKAGEECVYHVPQILSNN